MMRRLLVLILIAIAIAGCATTQQPSVQGGKGKGPHGNVTWNEIKNIKAGNLTEQEKEDLLHMIQEEKLARDVYLTLYNKWKLKIFQNIAKSEQTHMDSVELLLKKYGLKNPVEGLGVGKFADPKFTELYKKLVSEGSKSELDALKVGAMIEELDIADLQKCLNHTTKEDIRLVYENLMKGSRNHLRAFVSNIEKLGGTYVPKYISMQEFEKIVGSAMERGPAK